MGLNHVSFWQVFLPTTVLILAVIGKAHGAVDSPFCSQADPGEEKTLCNTLVNGAPTWEAALTNVIKAGLKEAEPVKTLINALKATLPPPLLPVSKDSIEKTCQESFESVMDAFNKALANIKNGDPYKSINSDLSAAASSLSDCTDGLDEFGADSPGIQKIRARVSKYASICLAVSFTKNPQ